jgi:hypothetical protein
MEETLADRVLAQNIALKQLIHSLRDVPRIHLMGLVNDLSNAEATIGNYDLPDDTIEAFEDEIADLIEAVQHARGQ